MIDKIAYDRANALLYNVFCMSAQEKNADWQEQWRDLMDGIDMHLTAVGCKPSDKPISNEAALESQRNSPSVTVQACREADRKMLQTEAGKELLAKAVDAFLRGPEHLETHKCGFDRNGSHNAGHYVCMCGWEEADTPEEKPVAWERFVDGKWQPCSWFVANGFEGKLNPGCRALYTNPVHIPDCGMRGTDRAYWLADKICAGGDYAKEAAMVLIEQAKKIADLSTPHAAGMLSAEPTREQWDAAWSAFGATEFEDLHRILSIDHIRRLYAMFHKVMSASKGGG